MAQLTPEEESLALMGMQYIPVRKKRIEDGMFTDMPVVTEQDRFNNLVYDKTTGEHGPPARQRIKDPRTLLEIVLGIQPDQGQPGGLLGLKVRKAMEDAGL